MSRVGKSENLFLIVSSQFIIVFSFDLKLLEIKNRKATQYELTLPISYMEQYIPFRLLYAYNKRIQSNFRNLIIIKVRTILHQSS